MKKTILSIICMIIFHTICNAQTKPAGVPEYNPDNPVFTAYSIVRDEANSVKNVLKNWGDRNIGVMNDDALRYLKHANEALAKLKGNPTEAKKEYVKFYTNELANLEAQRKEKYERFQVDETYSKKLDNYYHFALNDIPIQDKTLVPSYTGYYDFKKEFEAKCPAKFKEAYSQNQMKSIDNYFKVTVYELVPQVEAEVDKVIAEIHKINARGEENYLLNAKSYLKSFDRPMETAEYLAKYLLEEKAGIQAVQAKMEKEKSMLMEYISGGKYDAHAAKYKQEMIDAVHLGKEGMSNDTYTRMAIAGVKKGTVAKVVIISDRWYVMKNEFGFPLYKYLHLQLAITNYEGKCWLANGHIRKTYEGGGQYGEEHFVYYDIDEEMNCKNVK
ncbi:MAG: hypothetical protein ACKVTZ_09060 [Bacteroidia bacterium]